MEQNKIPTAVEFTVTLERYGDLDKTKAVLIAFSKSDVEAALKAAADNAKNRFRKGVTIEKTPSMWDMEIDKDSILNAYNLDNIQ